MVGSLESHRYCLAKRCCTSAAVCGLSVNPKKSIARTSVRSSLNVIDACGNARRIAVRMGASSLYLT